MLGTAPRKQLSNAQWNAVFERNHGAEMRAYYMPEARSFMGSSLSLDCQSRTIRPLRIAGELL
jgi:hypothetical protein